MLPHAYGQLSWQEEMLNLSPSIEQEEVVAHFHFVNTGEEPVEILKVDSSCGCTVGKLEKRRYAPGEEGALKAVFTPGIRTGTQQKRLTVHTNHGAQLLRLVVHLPEVASLSPRFLYWRKGSQPKTKRLRLKAEEGYSIRLEEIETPKGYEVSHKEVSHKELKKDKAYQIEVSPRNTQKRHKAKLTIPFKVNGVVTKSYTVYVMVK